MSAQLAVSEDDGEYYFEEAFSVPLDQPLRPFYDSGDFNDFLYYPYNQRHVPVNNGLTGNYYSGRERQSNTNFKNATLGSIRPTSFHLSTMEGQQSCSQIDSQYSNYEPCEVPPAFQYHQLAFSQTSYVSDCLSDANVSPPAVANTTQGSIIDSSQYSTSSTVPGYQSSTQSTWKQLREASKGSSSHLNPPSSPVAKNVPLRHNVRDLRKRRAGADCHSSSLLNIYQEEQRRMEQTSPVRPFQSPSGNSRPSWYSRMSVDITRSAMMDDVAVQTEPFDFDSQDFFVSSVVQSPLAEMDRMTTSVELSPSGHYQRNYIKNTSSLVRHPHGHIHSKRPQSLAFTSSGAPLQAKYFLGRSPSEEHMNRLSKLFEGPGVCKSQENLASLIPDEDPETPKAIQIEQPPPPRALKGLRSLSDPPNTPRSSSHVVHVPCNTRLPIETVNELPDLSFLKPKHETAPFERRPSKRSIFTSQPNGMNDLQSEQCSRTSRQQGPRSSTDYFSLTNLTDDSSHLLLDHGLCTGCAAILGRNLSPVAVPLLLDALEKHASVPNLTQQGDDSFLEEEISSGMAGDGNGSTSGPNSGLNDGLGWEDFPSKNSSLVRRFASAAQLPSSHKHDVDNQTRRTGKFSGSSKGANVNATSSTEPPAMCTSETHPPQQNAYASHSNAIQPRTSATSSSASFLSDGVANSTKKSVSFSEMVQMHPITGKPMLQHQLPLKEGGLADANELNSSLVSDSADLKVIPRNYGVYGDEEVLAQFALSPESNVTEKMSSKVATGKLPSSSKEKVSNSTALHCSLIQEAIDSVKELMHLCSADQSKRSDNKVTSLLAIQTKSVERFVNSFWCFLIDGMTSTGSRVPLFSKQRPKIWSMIEEICRQSSMSHFLSSTLSSSRGFNHSASKMDRTLFHMFVCNLLNHNSFLTWFQSLSSNKLILKKYYQPNALIIQCCVNSTLSDLHGPYSSMLSSLEELQTTRFNLSVSQPRDAVISSTLKKTPSISKKSATLPNGIASASSFPIRGRHDALSLTKKHSKPPSK